jgi:hypothetical protein
MRVLRATKAANNVMGILIIYVFIKHQAPEQKGF